MGEDNPFTDQLANQVRSCQTEDMTRRVHPPLVQTPQWVIQSKSNPNLVSISSYIPKQDPQILLKDHSGVPF